MQEPNALPGHRQQCDQEHDFDRSDLLTSTFAVIPGKDYRNNQSKDYENGRSLADPCRPEELFGNEVENFEGNPGRRCICKMTH